MESPQPPTTTIAALIQPGLTAIRRLWLPFLLIQACGLAVVIAYFKSPAFQAICERLAEIKRAGGYPFAALALGIACGVLPEIFKFITGIDRTLTRRRAGNILFNFLVFAIIGVACDAFYRLLAYLLGDSTSIKIILIKMSVDQFLFSPLFGTSFLAVAYTYREHRYRLLPALKSMGVGWYLSRALPVQIPAWAYWIPMASLMYALPSSLTFVFNAMAGAASAMLLVAVAERKVAQPNMTIAASPATSPIPSAALESAH